MTIRPRQGKRFDLVLICIALLSAFLNIFNIWNDQYANAYYTAAVTSMLQSWHNFFYASLDPGGYVTVDKPPVALWVQTLFACIFGVHGWSVILPQALACVGSVLLMYVLVKPTFGKTAALKDEEAAVRSAPVRQVRCVCFNLNFPGKSAGCCPL